MNKKIGLLFASILVIVQTLSVLHMAEHAFFHHVHNGKPCDISLSFDKSKASEPVSEGQNILVAYFVVKNSQENEQILKSQINSVKNPRAPPFIFLTYISFG